MRGKEAGVWFRSQKDILYCYCSWTRRWCSKLMCQTAEVINQQCSFIFFLRLVKVHSGHIQLPVPSCKALKITQILACSLGSKIWSWLLGRIPNIRGIVLAFSLDCDKLVLKRASTVYSLPPWWGVEVCWCADLPVKGLWSATLAGISCDSNTACRPLPCIKECCLKKGGKSKNNWKPMVLCGLPSQEPRSWTWEERESISVFN